MSATKNNNVDGSFYNMLNKYNLASVTLPSGTSATSNASVSPLFFPRAGHIYADSSSNSSYQYSINLGSWGYSWSSTISSAASAYYLYFDNSTVSPSANGYANSSRNDYHRGGRPVRCLVN